MKKTGTAASTAFYLGYMIFFTASIFSTSSLFSQQTTDSIHKPSKTFKNAVRVNVTSWVLYDNSFQVSYERVINKKQALNIFGGYNEFPLNISLDVENTAFAKTQSRSGYVFGAEYRFYLAKENRHPTPHGVYLAPFVSYYNFKSSRDLIHTDSMGVTSNANLRTDIGFFNIGGELGYQFVIGKRFVIDAVMFGPAFTNYHFKGRLDNNLPGIDDNEILEAVIDGIKEKFPLLNDISSEQGASSSGTQAFWSVGFRYNISIGFRF